MSATSANGTKSFYLNSGSLISRSQELYFDAGYTLDIPWNTVYTSGWMDGKPSHDTGAVWGTENEMITRRDPEYFAADNIVRSNIIPEINVNDPIYQFDRSQHTFRIF